MQTRVNRCWELSSRSWPSAIADMWSRRRDKMRVASGSSAPWAPAPRVSRSICPGDEQTNGKPYGVELPLPMSYESTGAARPPDRETVQPLLPPEQQAFVDDILRLYDVPPLSDQADEFVGRISVSPDSIAGLLDVAFLHSIRLVASALGEPPLELIERAHAGRRARGPAGRQTRTRPAQQGQGR